MEDSIRTNTNFMKQIQVLIYIAKSKIKQLSSKEELESANNQSLLILVPFMRANGLTI